MTTTTSHRSNPDRATHRSKYEITRTDRPVGEAFVLEVDGDPYARLAYAAYGDACEPSNPGLARRIRARLAATACGPAATQLTKHTAPALLEAAADANTAIWTSRGRGDYSGHDITASTTDNDRSIWVSIAESEPLKPRAVRELIAHLQYALIVVEGGPLNVDTYRARATYPRQDGGTGNASVEETTDATTVINFCREHRDQGHDVHIETRHWYTLTEVSDWTPIHRP